MLTYSCVNFLKFLLYFYFVTKGKGKRIYIAPLL